MSTLSSKGRLLRMSRTNFAKACGSASLTLAALNRVRALWVATRPPLSPMIRNSGPEADKAMAILSAPECYIRSFLGGNPG